MGTQRIMSGLRSLSRKLPFRRQEAGFVRRHERYEVRMAASILIEDRLVPLPGIINEISQGGLRFRPATTHLLDRRDEPGSIMVGDVFYPCRIMSTGTDGFGIKLSRLLDEQFVNEIVAEFGVGADLNERMRQVS